MAQLEELRAARGYIKSAITRIHNFCNSEKFATASLEAVLEKRYRLNKAFDEYEQYNRAILSLEPGDKEEYGLVEDKRDECSEMISRRLNELTSSGSSQQPSIASPGESPGKFKLLPPISLKSFDGKNIMEYQPFVNMFKAVIHSDVKLSSCEKLYYLRSYLTGEAFDLIKHLMFNDESYEVALKLLDDRFNNKPKIVNFHVNSIIDMPVCAKCTAHALRSIVSTVNMHLAALKNLNEPVEYWDTLLVNILAKKIDSYTYRGFHLERDMIEVPTLCEFLAFLEKRAVALEITNEEPQKPMRPVVSAAVTAGVSCAAAPVAFADTFGSTSDEY